MTDSPDQHLCRRSGPLWNAQLHTVWYTPIGATPPPPVTPHSAAAIHFTALGCCHRGGESLSQNSWWLVLFFLSLASTVWEYFQDPIYPLLKKKKILLIVDPPFTASSPTSSFSGIKGALSTHKLLCLLWHADCEFTVGSLGHV